RRRKEGPPLVMMFPCIPCGRDVELGEKGLTDCLRNLTLERIVESQGAAGPEHQGSDGCSCRASCLAHPGSGSGTAKTRRGAVRSAPLAPVIDTQRSLAYDQLFLCWRLPQESAPAWHFSVEYRRRGVVPGGASRGGIRGGLAAARWGWQRLDEVSGTSAVIDRLEMDSVYVLRVRGCNKAGYGEYNPGLYKGRFVCLVNSLCPLLAVFLSRYPSNNEASFCESCVVAADHALTSCHLTSDLLVGDVAITQGRHYWACSVEPGSYLVKASLFYYDPDSGHDSGAEDALDAAPPFCFLTMGMGKIYLPQHSYHHHNNHGNNNRDPLTNNNVPSSPTGLTYPLPPRLGVCLDFEKGRVTFYDAHSLRPLWEGHVDCSGPVCPAFCFIGGGALQLQELVANRNADQTPVRRVTIQPRVSNLNNNNN
ncbi:hypothetical protein GOODEAATRI_004290, partial [Goodea atripinnis]